MAVLIAGTALVAAPSIAAAALPVSAKTATLHSIRPPAVHTHGLASHAPRTLKAASSARLPARPRIAPRSAVFQSFIVDTASDPSSGTSCASGHTAGTCSLRAAITAANADAGHIDAITIPSGSNVILTLGTIDLTNSMYINATGATVNGSGAEVFDQIAGPNYPAVAITGLTITGGHASSGGGIYCNAGTLVLSQVTLSSNSATGDGGGIYTNGSCDLWVESSTFSQNTASDGGGLYLEGPANIERSLIGSSGTATGNVAEYGAGLYNEDGAVILADSSVVYNSSGGFGYGVGIYNDEILQVTNSHVDHNVATAGGDGAGLLNYELLDATNTSVSYNSISGSGNADGAGTYDDGYSTSLNNVSLIGNSSAPAAGDEVYGGALYEESRSFSFNGGTVAATTNGTAGANNYVEGGAIYLDAQDATLSGVNVSNTNNQAGTQQGVYGGAVSIGSHTRLENVSISNTVNVGYYVYGGAIYVSSYASMKNIGVAGTNNHVSGYSGGSSFVYGGVVYNDDYATISGFSATGTSNLADLGSAPTPSTTATYIYGGGFYNSDYLTVDGLSLTNLTATAIGGDSYVYGGAFYNSSLAILDNTQAVDTTVQADHYIYGGLFYNSDYMTANGFTLGNAHISVLGGPDASTPYVDGSIIYNDEMMNVVNGTIASVSSIAPSSASYLWAIETSYTMQLTNTTIANQALAGPGAGTWLIWVDTGGWMGLRNSIVDSYLPTLNCGVTGTGQIVSSGNNLDNGTSCGFTKVGDLESTNPMVLPLANNGGPVETAALQPAVGSTAGSPAIDAGTNVGCPSTDARGVVRPQGSSCDIGSYEVAAQGYWLAAPTGKVFHFGAGHSYGSLAGSTKYGGAIVAIVPTADRGGYWLVGAKGGVSTLGDAVSYGNLAQITPSAPVVSAAATPDGGGYWLVTQDGRVYPFGDAHNYGQMGRKHVIVGIAVTPDGMGYWLAASTGHVYTFGDAKSFGNAPKAIVGIATTPDGGGYWLLAATGRVYRFGDAVWYGSGTALKQPVVGMIVTPDGTGYWLIMSTGRVLRFGDAKELSTSVKTALVSAASANY
jgi:predicted outer membrane repeat protein